MRASTPAATPLQIITTYFLTAPVVQAQLALEVAQTILADRARQADDAAADTANTATRTPPLEIDGRRTPPALSYGTAATADTPTSIRRVRRTRRTPGLPAMVNGAAVVAASAAEAEAVDLPPQGDPADADADADPADV